MEERAIRRIAMLSVHTSPLATLGGKKTGGMNVYVRDLSRELGRRGIAVDVFTRRSDRDHPAVTRFGDNARTVLVPAGPARPLGTGDIYPHLPQFVAGVLAFTGEEALTYDIIFSHYWLSGWVAHELRARWGVPVAQMFHTLGRMKNRIAQRATEQETDIRIFTETDIMSWADRLIAATPAERAQMLWLYRADRRKIEVVPPGVDLDRFGPLDPREARAALGLTDNDRMLLFVGRIEPLKRVDQILQAVARLRAEEPALMGGVCVWIIGGDGEDVTLDAETARLRALRDELGLRERVRFLGAQEQDRLPTYYRAAVALIMPSDYESFGMVALEAMACGTPVIASEVGGLAFLVEDGVTGFHVPSREPAALAGRIRAILTRPERRAQMGRAARAVARRYGWAMIAGRLLAIFESMHQTRPAARTPCEGRSAGT